MYHSNQTTINRAKKLGADKFPTWVTLVDGGLLVKNHGETYPELIGTVTNERWVVVKWQDGKFVDEKPYIQGDIIESDYIKKIDLSLDVNSEIMRLSLFYGSIQNYLNYKEALKQKGKNIYSSDTKVQSIKEGSYKNFAFSIA